MIVSHSCGVQWSQRGNLTGHCSNCHLTFDSLESFDRHQRVIRGRCVCTEPQNLAREDGTPAYQSRADTLTTYWRLAPTEAQVASLAALTSR